MIVCPSCNVENEEGSKFCKECGVKFEEIVCNMEEDAASDSVNTNDKKHEFDFHKVGDIIKNFFNKVKSCILFRSKKNSLITAISALLVFVLIAGVLNSGALFYKIAYNSNSVGVANAIRGWNNNHNKRVAGNINNYLKNEANEIYDLYLNGNLSFDDVSTHIKTLSLFTDTTELNDRCIALNDSRKAFEEAKMFMDRNETKKALELFQRVIEEDLNYKEAQKHIEVCKLKISNESFETAKVHEANEEWFDAVKNYSSVVSADENYPVAQNKIIELKKKLLDDTLNKLGNYKASNDYTSALQLIDSVSVYIDDEDLEYYKEHFTTQKDIANVVKFDYNHGPFTLYERYSDGDIMSAIYVDTFNITSAKKSYDGKDIVINCEVTGVVTGSNYCSFEVKCYNSKGFITESADIFASVSNNEPFKINDEIFIPVDTVKIEFAADN